MRLHWLAVFEETLNVLPQVGADRGGFIGNRSTGTATVYLRNLGCNRTPVLIGGRRLMPGDPTIGGAAPDLNFISNSLVERVECSPGRLGLCLVPQGPAGRAIAP